MATELAHSVQGSETDTSQWNIPDLASALALLAALLCDRLGPHSAILSQTEVRSDSSLSSAVAKEALAFS